jgi:class 3 adenylate cyclase
MTDIEGLTPLVDSLAPERFRALVAQFHQLAEAVLEEFEGFSGTSFADASVAIFRSPLAAVRAATEFHQRIGVHAWPERGLLRVRIGVHSGEVVTTAYGPFGHPVNLCALICSVARGGQTVLSEVTQGLLRDRDLGGLELADLGERELGGSAIRLYEIVDGAPNS